MEICFFGLGNLGEKLVKNLLKDGHRVFVHDLSPEAVRRSVAEGAVALGAHGEATETALPDAVKEKLASCQMCISCLPSPRATRACLSGLFPAMRPGTIWLEMSTNAPREIATLVELAEGHGIRPLSAPVTGGVHLAARGTITVLVGGDEAVYQEALPTLRAMGGKIFYIGTHEQALILKIITNMLALVHLVVAGDALLMAKAYSIDPALAFEAIRASSGNSFVHETESQVVLNGSYNIGFTMDLALKDLGFAIELGRTQGVPLPLVSLAEQVFIAAKARFGGEAWSPKVVALAEEHTGLSLRADGFPDVIE